ncbi:ECF transporter S component [Enterocloster clostridioformis]
MEKKITIREICLVGLMAAAVYVASEFLQIPIPTAIDNTRLHMGNVMCLLGGLLLGPVWGGLSAGIGSALFDLTNPAYITSAPFTFAFKFIMAWVCGMIAKGGKKGKKVYRCFVGAGLGAFIYVVLYLTKSFIENYFVLHIPFSAVWLSIGQKGIVSIINAVVSVIVVVPLSMALQPAISRMLSK